MSTRLCLSLWLICFLCFRFDVLTELGAFMRTRILCISVLRVASGPRVKLASCKSDLVRFGVFGFVCFLFLSVYGKGCGLWLWHSLNFSLTCFYYICHCMSLHVCPGDFFLFWIAVWPILFLGKELPFGFLLVVLWLWHRCFKCVLLSLLCLGRKMSGN